MFSLGVRWGGSLVDDTVCWAESLHDRSHISHTGVGLVLTKVQNWQIHCGREQEESGAKTPLLREAVRLHTNLSVRVCGRRSEAGKLGRYRRASSQAGSLAHLTEDAAALIHHRAALTLPL